MCEWVWGGQWEGLLLLGLAATPLCHCREGSQAWVKRTLFMVSLPLTLDYQLCLAMLLVLICNAGLAAVGRHAMQTCARAGALYRPKHFTMLLVHLCRAHCCWEAWCGWHLESRRCTATS